MYWGWKSIAFLSHLSSKLLVLFCMCCSQENLDIGDKFHQHFLANKMRSFFGKWRLVNWEKNWQKWTNLSLKLGALFLLKLISELFLRRHSAAFALQKSLVKLTSISLSTLFLYISLWSASNVPHQYRHGMKELQENKSF